MNRKKIIPIILSFGIIFTSTISIFNIANGKELSQDQYIALAENKVKEFKSCPVFSTYNKCYEALCKIKDQGIREKLGSEIAPYWNKVATPYVLDGLKRMEALANDKNLLTFNDLMLEIKNSSLKTEEDRKFNEGYLLGELDGWAKSGSLYTKEECSAIDKIVYTWNNKTEENVNECERLISKVAHPKSRQWLQGEVNNIKKLMKVDNKNEDKPKPTRPGIKTGWDRDIDGKYIYLDENGNRIKNKIMNINGKSYAFDENGLMRTGWFLIKNRGYYGYKNGVLAQDEVSEGWKFDSDCRAIKYVSNDMPSPKIPKFVPRGNLVYHNPITGDDFYDCDILWAKALNQQNIQLSINKYNVVTNYDLNNSQNVPQWVKLEDEFVYKYEKDEYHDSAYNWINRLASYVDNNKATPEEMMRDTGYIISKNDWNMYKAWYEPADNKWYKSIPKFAGKVTVNCTNTAEELHNELKNQGMYNISIDTKEGRVVDHYYMIPNEDRTKLTVVRIALIIKETTEPKKDEIEETDINKVFNPWEWKYVNNYWKEHKTYK
ncbi:hypothetical protein [Clostridium fallax]|uniref:Cell wall binding repeat-containing protein n=1 Tax=Clostridium fallax TaxID=1533 RepID=A0A1M4XK29_9CLOT|nr:hypothetical protein [Clostridium fallax]SHE93859.1 hypothetical protein SAMN05443638_11910 [Clostridium fallax]SQB06372.1 glycoside hydrolase family protein [Clostridium fallax]